MPDWLRAFSEHQPVTLIVDAVRGLVLNQVDGGKILEALAWCIGILIVFVPLAVWAYGRRVGR
jgi:ABC-2 type transport system permease protein/oleandomycin transport system permease protein